ncbi:hypothetical protein EXN66_Car002386 [Channa argus]|uniref:Uncharacterized protein n=1 Tax=Channa argus TaxID=215402 RepID=A0A6G1P9B4_CHAAH|nr:hypothetical protein EXN66_Car002386 [Channa argus]
MTMYSSEFILVLPSCVISLLKICELVADLALQAQTMTVPPECFTEELSWFGS